jgi:hypothetical protein
MCCFFALSAVAFGLAASLSPATGQTYRPSTAPTALTYGSMANASLGIGANLNGATPFPSDNAWNTDISNYPVDPNSDNLIASIGLVTGLHPGFGSGTYQGAIIGIPYIVVGKSQPGVLITFT